MLPIVHRELQVAARSPRFYSGRLRVSIVVLGIAAMLLVMQSASTRISPAGTLFRTLSFLGLLFCLLEGLSRTSDSVSREKREGTLGLLFLTDLSGFDIILGKLSAALVHSFNTLLAIVPVFAVTLLLGGTTGGELARTTLLFAASLAVSLSICLLASTLSRQRAIAASVSALTALCIGPLILARTLPPPWSGWASAVSPFQLLQLRADAAYGTNVRDFWTGIALLCGLALGAILLASLIIPRAWQDKPVKPRIRRRGPAVSVKALKTRGAMLDRNPVMWLLFQPAASRMLRAVSIAVGISAVIGTILAEFTLRQYFSTSMGDWTLIPPLGASALLVIIASVYVARESSRGLVEPRQNGMFELMLSTPLKTSEIIAGVWLAIRVATLPTLVIVTALVAYCTGAMILAQSPPTNFFALAKIFVESILGIFTIGAVGMWMGLSSRTAARAFVKTLALGFLLPHFFCTPTLLNLIALGLVASERVRSQLRRLVSEQYLQSGGFILAEPPPAAATPPVLR